MCLLYAQSKCTIEKKNVANFATYKKKDLESGCPIKGTNGFKFIKIEGKKTDPGMSWVNARTKAESVLGANKRGATRLPSVAEAKRYLHRRTGATGNGGKSVGLIEGRMAWLPVMRRGKNATGMDHYCAVCVSLFVPPHIFTGGGKILMSTIRMKCPRRCGIYASSVGSYAG